jgi:hypothetical protein
MTSLATDLPRVTGFDFLVGDWTVRNLRLRRPLSGETEWYETMASATSWTLHNGAISIDEMWFAQDGFAGCSIRLYDPTSGRWTIHWVNSRTGELQAPVVGRWDGAEFTAEGPDDYHGCAITAKYIWTDITPEAATWAQDFSIDDGRTWERNWIMQWQRRG